MQAIVAQIVLVFDGSYRRGWVEHAGVSVMVDCDSVRSSRRSNEIVSVIDHCDLRIDEILDEPNRITHK